MRAWLTSLWNAPVAARPPLNRPPDTDPLVMRSGSLSYTTVLYKNTKCHASC